MAGDTWSTSPGLSAAGPPSGVQLPDNGGTYPTYTASIPKNRVWEGNLLSMSPTDPLNTHETVVHLSGERFEEVGMPVDCLEELSSLQTLIKSLARIYWLESHQGRKRIPSGFNKAVDLRLTRIESGCSLPVMETERPEASGKLFSNIEVFESINHAVEDINYFFDNPQKPYDDLPHALKRIPIGQIKKIGKTLAPNEYMQVSAGMPESWSQRATYNAESRKTFIQKISRVKYRTINIVGDVLRINVAGKSLVIRDGYLEQSVTVPYGDESLPIHHATEHRVYHAKARVEASIPNGDGPPVVQRTLELAIEDITQLREIEGMVRDMVDLDGSPIPEKVRERALSLVDDFYKIDRLTAVVGPGEDGGIQFYWPDDPGQLTIDVEEDLSIYLHRISGEDGQFFERKVGPEEALTGEILEVWFR